MPNRTDPWDYLIVTAANTPQAAAYETQIQLRREAGELAQVRHVLVIPDRDGRRVGSGGSTLQCLAEVLRRESQPGGDWSNLHSAETILGRLRILIVHAGGDSRRLPAYSPCGKIFIPLPGDSHSVLGSTLFDRLVPVFLGLPAGTPGAGQVAIASGDALIRFDPTAVRFGAPGITALGAPASPEEAARHGVFCPNPDGSVRLYLQKPDVRTQRETGAIGLDGRAVLDAGVMSFDCHAAARLLWAFRAPPAREAILSHGIDLYREVCCALGTETTLANYVRSARQSGSTLDESLLASLFDELHSIPLHLQVLDGCSFLHFGSTSQLISSGLELLTQELGAPPATTILAIDTDIHADGRIDGQEVWVEGCRLRAPLRLRRRNVVVGVDVLGPLELPEGACLDISSGLDRKGGKVCFIRCCGVNDTFKRSLAEGATFCGKPLVEWLLASGAPVSGIWDDATPVAERTLWNARMFPAEKEHRAFRRWLWMFDISSTTPAQKLAFRSADRYSSAEIAVRADHTAFYARRAAIRAAARPRSG
ncbi:MAG: L-fucokinase [Bryobacteraceae bacterium]|jgi:fucokinase